MYFSTPIIFYGNDFEVSMKQARLEASKILSVQEKYLNECPDFQEITTKSYASESISMFLKDIHLSTYQKRKKIYLFLEIDKLSLIHANMLLKIFEEQPSHAIIFLISRNIASIPLTLLSRCKRRYVFHVEQKDSHLLPSLQEKLLQLWQLSMQKKFFICLSLIDQIEKENPSLEDMENFFLSLQLKKNILSNSQKIAIDFLLERFQKAQLAQEMHIRMKYILEYIFFFSNEK